MFAGVSSVALAGKPVGKPADHIANNSLVKAKELKVQEIKAAQVGTTQHIFGVDLKRKTSNRINVAMTSVDGTKQVVKLKLANVAASGNPNAATIVLTADDTFGDGSGVWGDGTGYQLLLDSKHDIDWDNDVADFGNEDVCDFQAIYDKFDYKLPKNADGLCTTENVHVVGTISSEVPAGIYDVLITNPCPGLFATYTIFIAGYGAFDNLPLNNGFTYTFFISIEGMGDNVDLSSDDPALNPPTPASLYNPPLGTLYMGWTKDWVGYSTFTWAIAPPYTTWNFQNLTPVVSAKQATAWNYMNLDTEEEYSAETTDLAMDVTSAEYYTFPTLTTSIGTDTTSFTNGAFSRHTDTEIDAGGGYYDNGTYIFGLTNLNTDFGTAYWQFSAGDYMFGTGTTNPTMKEALISYFKGDPNKYVYFEGVSVFFGTLTGPADTELTLTLAKASISANGVLTIGDTVAISKTTIGDAYFKPGTTVGALQFTKFFTTDEFGFEAPVDYLEMQGSFVLMLSGYNVSGVALAVVSERDARPAGDTEKCSYMLGKDGKYYSYTSYNFRMFFQLETSYYSYITSETKEVTADNAGGNYPVKLLPFFNGAWVENELPDWLDVTFQDNYVHGDWYTIANIAVSPLADVTGRSFNIEFATWGARYTVTVKQGDVSGIPMVTTVVTDTKVVNRNGNFELTYAQGYSAVSVYNVAGQKVAGYALPATGTFTVPSGNYSQGVYLFRFTGAKGASTVKVLK